MSREAIQLYTLRDLEEPLPEILERVAAAGFEGVEFANRLQETDPELVATALDETGLEPIGAHVSLSELESNLETHITRCETVGCRTLVIPHLPISHFRTADNVVELAERLNTVGASLDERDFDLLYHNQDHDFLSLTDRTPISRLLIHDVSPQPISGLSIERRVRALADRASTLGGILDDRLFEQIAQRRGWTPDPIIGGTAFGQLVTATDPDLVSFEVDVGAITAAGYDPVEVLDRVQGRVPQVHMKDVAVDRGLPGSGQRSVEPGTGDVDFQAAADAARRAGAEWLIYEHDEPNDPIETLHNGARSIAPLLTTGV